MEVDENTRRLGLALSGGGFRASFFHLGVLARMAELGMLKHVESISTVSGGSIVGAGYYLLLKRLLESKADRDITDRDYVDLVIRLEAEFRWAVQKNLRMRTFANPWKNIKMALPSYSRSDTLGELYEKYIYQPLLGSNKPISMRDLLIVPFNETEFHPRDGNASRINKVPVLILNATSLNSGHNWVFTASRMGEVPPRNLIFRDIDKRDRYRRVRYDEITTRRQDFPLGKAVAASAGVPGLFPPMAVSNLYQERRVQLVDGGVYDNQGIAGLLDPVMRCSDFIVSDAAGQSDATDNPDTSTLPVVINVSGIMGGRVREEMINNLVSTRPGQVAYFHLTRGLFARDIEFNQRGISQGPGAYSADGITDSETEFDVSQRAQSLLAHLRTDLDSFTDAEALSLEANAYQMAQPRLLELKRYLSPERTTGQWPFEPCLALLARSDAGLLKQLDLGRHQFFKPLLYVLNGAADSGRVLGLLFVSLPLIMSLAAIAYGFNWLVNYYAGFDIVEILGSRAAFQDFAWKVAPAIYTILLSFILSKAADILIRGSGNLAGWIQKVLKGPMSLIKMAVIRALLPALFAIPVLIYIYTIDWYFVKRLNRLS